MMRILVTTEFCNNAKKLADEKDPTGEAQDEESNLFCRTHQ